jgi:AraC-like DNA-binding protein
MAIVDTSDVEVTAYIGLVTSSAQFLHDVLPFRHPESRDALTTYLRALERPRAPTIVVDAVLIRCLALLDEHTGGQLPTLVDRYLRHYANHIGLAERFSLAIQDTLTYLGIADGVVQTAIHILNSRYSDSKCTPQSVARELGVRLSSLCAAFKRWTGMSLRTYLRNVRLDRSAHLLVETNQSIKEIWVHIGYNHPSNFDHDFKRRFSVTPSGYRARGLRPVAQLTCQGSSDQPLLENGAS